MHHADAFLKNGWPGLSLLRLLLNTLLQGIKGMAFKTRKSKGQMSNLSRR